MKKNMISASLIVVIVASVISCAFLPKAIVALIVGGAIFCCFAFTCVYLGAKSEAKLRRENPEAAKLLDEYREHMDAMDRMSYGY